MKKCCLFKDQTKVPIFSEVNNYKCGYTGHFYRGKWPLSRGKLGVVRVTGLSRDKFAMENIHGYVKKKKEIAHDI